MKAFCALNQQGQIIASHHANKSLIPASNMPTSLAGSVSEAGRPDRAESELRTCACSSPANAARYPGGKKGKREAPAGGGRVPI